MMVMVVVGWWWLDGDDGDDSNGVIMGHRAINDGEYNIGSEQRFEK